MNVADRHDDELRQALAVEPPAHLEQRLSLRLDELRALHAEVQRGIARAVALRLGLALVVVALVNGLSPRALLGPLGRWLDGLDRWSHGLHLPDRLLTFHAPALLAAALMVAGGVGRVLADLIARRSAT